MALSAIGIGITIWQANVQQETSAQQFERTMRQNQYADIVSGMASSSVGVQVNSIRALVQHVREPANYGDDADLQEQAAINAAQTLTAFIEDESSVPGQEGLSDYRDPQPVVVARALDQLVELTGLKETAEEADQIRFPGISVDLSRGNFHGVSARDFAPEGSFGAVGADFRNASVTGWDLSGAAYVNLSSAFFTCADLQQSNLGTAVVAAADFTGANLRGADLSGVQGLTSEQLVGALTAPGLGYRPESRHHRREKRGASRRTATASARRPPAGSSSDRMTNLLAGSGFGSPTAVRGQVPVADRP